ncbi:MAG TPA: serine/threonine-protein kinase [Polyangiaceae bacterium]
MRLVGEGGMGRVYEAEERLSKRRVALKVLRPELVKDEDGRRMFLSEMQILASLEHPNVVRSLASLEHEGQLVLVLEYLEGKTLRALLNERDLSWAEAVDIGAQVASALAAAHERDIVHRDLKPENVMVLEDGTTKVMDFGIAKVLEHAQGKSTQSLGTLQYMSPEQIDAGAIDGRTDLYALGLVLYEMLTGKPPFRSASPRELLNLQCTAEPPAFAEDVEAPAGVVDLVFELLAKAREERPQSAEDVLATLSPFRVGKKRPKATPSSSKRSARAESVRTGAVTPSGTLRSPKRVDTVALLEKATAAREIRVRTAIVAIAIASIFSGGITYGLRVHQSHAKWAAPATTER